MEEIQLGHIVAKREYELDTHTKVTVLIGQPQPVDDGRTYFCPYQIVGMGQGRVRRAGGADSVQALYLALQRIATDLYTSDEHRDGRLTLDGMRNLGLPVPSSIADLVPPENE